MPTSSFISSQSHMCAHGKAESGANEAVFRWRTLQQKAARNKALARQHQPVMLRCSVKRGAAHVTLVWFCLLVKGCEQGRPKTYPRSLPTRSQAFGQSCRPRPKEPQATAARAGSLQGCRLLQGWRDCRLQGCKLQEGCVAGRKDDRTRTARLLGRL